MYKNKHEKSRLIFCKPIGYVNVQTLLIYFINSCNYSKRTIVRILNSL